MNQSVNLVVPASGGKVEIVFPVSVGSSPRTLTFDIPAPGGTIIINLTPSAVQAVGVDASCSQSKSSSWQQSGSPTPAPMLFSSLPCVMPSMPFPPAQDSRLPIDKPPVVKYTPIPRPEPKPRITSSVPCRTPPEPGVHLEDAPAIPADLSNCDLVMYGYFIDDKFCKEKGFDDCDDASNAMIECMEALRISTFAKLATFPANAKIDLVYFAVRGRGGSVCTVGKRGVPTIKLKELEARMGLKSACWISFDEVSQSPT